MNVMKLVLQNNMNKIIPIIQKWGLQDTEFKKGMIRIKLEGENAKEILSHYESKLVEKNGSKTFMIKGAAIGTTIKRIIRKQLNSEFDQFLNSIDARLLMNQVKDEVYLYLLFRGKFYTLTNKLLLKIQKDLKEDITKQLNDNDQSHLLVYLNPEQIIGCTKVDIIKKCFKTIRNPLCWKEANYTLVPKEISIKSFLTKVLKMEIPDNIDFLGYFQYTFKNDSLEFVFNIYKKNIKPRRNLKWKNIM